MSCKASRLEFKSQQIKLQVTLQFTHTHTFASLFITKKNQCYNCLLLSMLLMSNDFNSYFCRVLDIKNEKNPLQQLKDFSGYSSLIV